jgi:hypothetical protein
MGVRHRIGSTSCSMAWIKCKQDGKSYLILSRDVHSITYAVNHEPAGVLRDRFDLARKMVDQLVYCATAPISRARWWSAGVLRDHFDLARRMEGHQGMAQDPVHLQHIHIWGTSGTRTWHQIGLAKTPPQRGVPSRRHSARFTNA